MSKQENQLFDLSEHGHLGLDPDIFENQDISPEILQSLALQLLTSYVMEQFKADIDMVQNKELVRACSSVAEYAHDNDIPNIMFVDRGARPAYIGVSEAWNRKYSDEEHPNFYFINPTGFLDIRSGLHLRREMRMFSGIAAMREGQEKGNDTGSFFATSRSKPVIDADFLTTYPKLAQDKESPLLLMDTCIHGGSTIEPLLKALDRMNFSDVRFGVFEDTRNYSDITPDFVVHDAPSLGGCYPFSYDKMVNRTFASVTSEINNNSQEVAAARKSRQALSKMFRSAPDEWFY